MNAQVEPTGVEMALMDGIGQINSMNVIGCFNI